MMTDTILLRRASIEDAKEIAALMRAVYEALENKELFLCDDEEYVTEHLSDQRKGYGVVACTETGEIIGSFVMVFPGMSDGNLGRDIKLEPAELEKVVHMDSAVVHPDYRGRGLQDRMLRYAETMPELSGYRYLMATVSPHNPASYRTLEKNGYRHVKTKEKYKGYERRIYLKDLFEGVS